LAVTSTTQGLRIAVTGLIAQHPSLGGVTWDYVQYAAGLQRLGHDGDYLEDSGEWPYTLDGGPSGNDWIAHDCTPNVTHLAHVMEPFGLTDRWAYRFPIKPLVRHVSCEAARNPAQCELLINVSGSLERPSEYRCVRRLPYIDSDPVFTQIKLVLPRGHVKSQISVSAHDVHFSFSERLSRAVPTTPYRRQPIRQPILMSEWSLSGYATHAYTTVTSWASYQPLHYCVQRDGQKDLEFRRFIGLAAQVPEATLDVALNSTEHLAWETDRDSFRQASRSPASPLRRVTAAELLTSAGWNVIDARAACSDLDRRSFIQRSRGEWSIAKNRYVKGRSELFSCRSACDLAAGRPVVVHDTGFSRVIPTGIGVLTFNTLEEVTAAVKEVESDYHRHAKAARDIAVTYFDSDRVLSNSVERAMANQRHTELQRVGA
jgi:hypothetical protein